MELRCGFEGPLRLGSYLSFSLISCLFRIVLVCGGGGFDTRALEVDVLVSRMCVLGARQYTFGFQI